MRRPSFIARQAAHPAGLVGRLLLGVMARETGRFNAEIVDALAPADGEHILELGYGHGRTLALAAARAAGARLAGIDLAPTAAQSASRRCRSLIDTGRLDLRTGDSAALPWTAGTFDAVFSVHTLYFWPDPAVQLAELHRVLRAGGRLVLGFRARSEEAVSRFPAAVYRFYDGDELAALLAAAGFGDVVIRTSAIGADLRIATAHARTIRAASAPAR